MLIVTDFRMSTTALDVVSTSTHAIREIGRPLLPATHLVAHPGTCPTATVPVLDGRPPDVGELWTFLAEVAGFFGVPMPQPEAIGIWAAVSGLSVAVGPIVERVVGDAMVAISVTVVELAGSPEFVVTGREIRPSRSEPVRIDVCDVSFPLTRATDPLWRRMAARTTSRALKGLG